MYIVGREQPTNMTKRGKNGERFIIASQECTRAIHAYTQPPRKAPWGPVRGTAHAQFMFLMLGRKVAENIIGSAQSHGVDI